MPNAQLAVLVVAVCLTSFEAPAQAQRHPLFSFDAPAGAVPSGIARGRDGTLYGVTREGGTFGKGAVVAVSRGTARALYSFQGQTDGATPSSLVLANDGALYGFSSLPVGNEGPSQSALFRVTRSGTFSVLAKLTGPSNNMALTLGQDGVLYVSSGYDAAVLALDAYGGGLKPVFRFADGVWANQLVVTRRGELFATTVQAGPSKLVHASQGGPIQELASLPAAADGSQAESATALARASDGTLYLATQGGPSVAVYSWKGSGPLQSLGTLDAPASALVAAGSGNGVIGATSYGGSASQGSLFQIAGGKLSVLADLTGGAEGGRPNSLIASANGVYGAAASGGGGGVGTFFQYRAGADVSAAYSFTYPNGAGPTSLLLGSDGALYGVTQEGGPGGAGTAFKADMQGNVELLHAFQLSEGVSPQNILEGRDGALYGRTELGGSAGFGTLFKLDKNGTLTILAQFTQEGQGRGPRLVQLEDGTLYGADQAGSGHIFRFAAGGQLEQVHAFTGLMTREGASPTGLVAGPNGVLYGITRGAYGPMIPPPYSHGTVFRVNTDGSLDTLYSFNDDGGALGALPSSLVIGQDGVLYGNTGNLSFLCNVRGGLWKLAPESGGKPQPIYAFKGPEDGTGPTSLLQTRAGRLFGLTLGGAAPVDASGTTCSVHNSTLFEDTEPAGFRTLAQLDLVIGASVNSVSAELASSLVEGEDGRLYGTLANGGSTGSGELFVFDVPPPAAAAQ